MISSDNCERNRKKMASIKLPRAIPWFFFLILIFFSSSSSSFSSSSPKNFRSTSTEKMRLGLEKTLFVIVSQENEFHVRAANRLRDSLRRQGTRVCVCVCVRVWCVCVRVREILCLSLSICLCLCLFLCLTVCDSVVSHGSFRVDNGSVPFSS